jgi:hypothetical protein
MRYMDYDFFNSEYKKYEDWESNYLPKSFNTLPDTISFGPAIKDPVFHPFGEKDMVNSPAHYTRGKQECIDIIEEAIQDAPDVKAGMLQGQALKYMLRLWLKGNASQDAEKCRWYLNRLIEHLADTPGER